MIVSPTLSRRAAKALQYPGTNILSGLDERWKIVDAIEKCETWEDLPLGVRAKLEKMERINAAQ